MSTHLFDHRAPPPRSRAAWLASFAVHASMLAALAYVSWTTLGGAAGRRPAAESAVVLGLSDGAGNGADLSQSDSAAPLLEPPPGDAPLDNGQGAGLSAESTMTPLVQAEASAEPITPAPQLPLLALGATTPGRTAAANRSSSQSGGSPNVAAQLRQLEERATVTVFGAVGEGSRFVYLFDRSTSMEGVPLAAAKQQLLASLEPLNGVHQFQVIFFNHEVQAWDLTGGQQRIPYASESNKRLAGEFVRTVVATGGTDRLAPLRRALALTPDVVFFLTDADDAMPAYDVADVVERARRSSTAIACIEFGARPQREAENFLTRLAHDTGGDYVYVDTTSLVKQ